MLPGELRPTAWSHWSTVDSGIICSGAIFAGNYFGGEVMELALEIANRPNFGGALGGDQGYDANRIWMVVEDNGHFGLPENALYNEFTYIGDMAMWGVNRGKYSATMKANVEHWYEKFHGITGEPTNLGVTPMYHNYYGIQLLSNVNWWLPSTYHVQFPPFYFKTYHSNSFYRTVNHNYLRGIYFELSTVHKGYIIFSRICILGGYKQ